MTDTAVLAPGQGAVGPAVSRAVTPARALAASAALVGLGAMHFALDGLTSVLVTIQPHLAARTGAGPAMLSLVVGAALATASLLQPLAARLSNRFGERWAAATGSALAALGYGSVPATGTVPHTIAAVVVGGLGSALFHPAAGALVVRGAKRAGGALPLAAFSAVGTAGAALVPMTVLGSLPSLGWAAAVPVAVALVALSLATRSKMFAATDDHQAATTGANGRATGGGQVRVAIAAAALLALASITTGATAPVLLAEVFGPAHPALAWSAAMFSAAGAGGGVLLAVIARRLGARRVLLPAVVTGGTAAAAVPLLPTPLVFPAMALAGGGLSGTLPLLMAHARRPGETSAAGAVGRVLGLGAGLGAVGYVLIGFLQSTVGYAASLTMVVGVAAVAAAAVTWFLCRSADPAMCRMSVSDAATTCPCGSCSCA
jgi:MFS transporter, FSR family, fosmidomycin resistance protein